MSFWVDTDWVVEYLKGRPPAAQILPQLRHEGLAISLITHGELYEGIYAGQDPGRHEIALKKVNAGCGGSLPVYRADLRIDIDNTKHKRSSARSDQTAQTGPAAGRAEALGPSRRQPVYSRSPNTPQGALVTSWATPR